MSYGIWKKRGKGWSSFEIDGCDDWRWNKMPAARSRHLQKKARELGFRNPSSCDPSFVIWWIGQQDRGRSVEQVNTQSDHELWVSYEDDQSLLAALAAHGYCNLNGERLHATA